MRTTARTTLLAALVCASGCGLFHKSTPPTEIKAGAAQRREEWTADLFTPSKLAGAMQVRGTAQWTRDGTDASTASVNISNATPGGVHPWHIHRGRCGENGPIVGDASDYKPLTVDDKGNASGSAKLKLPMPMSGDYYVNVHASADNLGTIISCGNLAPPIT